jgi:hypothetical protein
MGLALVLRNFETRYKEKKGGTDKSCRRLSEHGQIHVISWGRKQAPIVKGSTRV